MSDRPKATERVRLEREANLARERLLDTLHELDHRRHLVQDAPAEAVRPWFRGHRRLITSAVVAAIAGVAGVLGYSVVRRATRERRLREERWSALVRAFRHPERVAQRAPPAGSLASQVARKALLAALGYVAVELTKRAVSRVLPLVRLDGEGAPLPRVVVRTLPA